MTEPLSDVQFADVVRFAPLVSIDLVIRDPDGAMLVGMRSSAPAKGFWFVPGGRIRKNETIRNAFARILKAETGCDAAFEARDFSACSSIYIPTTATAARAAARIMWCWAMRCRSGRARTSCWTPSMIFIAG
jgi:8-oxo-dGTP pyrophosphatase MutT (NUDIX family)